MTRFNFAFLLVLALALVAGVSRPAAAQNATSTDIQRLQDSLDDASRDVSELRSRDSALASRLQSYAEPGTILISHETYALVKDAVPAEEQAAIQAKGFAKPVRNYRVLDPVDSVADQNRVIREEHDGLRVFLDLQKLGKAAAIRTLQTMLSRIES